MAHSQDTAEAVGVSGEQPEDATSALEQLLDADDADGDESGSTDDQIDDDLSLEEDGEDDGESEPSKSAIAAPVSLNADEKAQFAQLPEDAQRFITSLETRRNEQVQQVTTKASNAQRDAEARAAQADAQAKQVYAQQLKHVISAFRPAAPDPAIAQTDPGMYIALKAQHDADAAQFDQFEQQVSALDGQASQEIDNNFIQARDRELMALPEVRDEATRSQFFEKAVRAATNLGLETEALNTATAAEWQKLRQIDDWKDKADKYDAAMARKMQRVRQGKGRTNRPGAAQPSSAPASTLQKQFEARPSRDTAAAMLEAYLG